MFLLLVLLRRAGWHRALTRATLTDAYAVMALGVGLATVLSYATSVFTIIPIWLGGGMPEAVRLELRAPLEHCAPCGDEVRLIDEDGTHLVILLANDTAVEIARSEVRAVVSSLREPAGWWTVHVDCGRARVERHRSSAVRLANPRRMTMLA